MICKGTYIIKIIIIFIRENMDCILEEIKENNLLRCGKHSKIFIQKSHKLH